MKTMWHEGKLFWMVTDTSAVRHEKKDRWNILSWHDGEIKDVVRTVRPDFYAQVKRKLEGAI